MSIEGDIQAALSSLVSGRCYPMVAPDPVTKPYIVYQVITETPVSTIKGNTILNNMRVQVDVYHTTYGGVKALGGKSGTIKTAMAGASFKAIHLMSQDLHESDTQLFRINMDFRIWS